MTTITATVGVGGTSSYTGTSGQINVWYWTA